MEKPFASSLDDADRMIRAMQDHGRQLAINWPLRWYASHVTAYRLVREALIGTVQQVHFYDGNRGPLWHGADKIEKGTNGSRKRCQLVLQKGNWVAVLCWIIWDTVPHWGHGTWTIRSQRKSPA
ncbi:MAG: hypothetical protein R3C28_23830 [Pirellulaceae bacterium]